MDYDIILFDLDDTLLDFEITEKNALERTFSQFNMPDGLARYRNSYRAISSVLWSDLEEGSITLNQLKTERFARLFIEHELAADAEQFGEQYIANLGSESHVIDGVETMLQFLSSRTLAILTNGFTIAQRARVQNSGLGRHFEAIIASEETGFRKPEPAIFEYTLRLLNAPDRSRVLMVGDSLTSDIRGGQLSGIDTCWYNPTKRENITGILPTYEVQSWEQFTQLFAAKNIL